jgi:hypothetical protein
LDAATACGDEEALWRAKSPCLIPAGVRNRLKQCAVIELEGQITSSLIDPHSLNPSSAKVLSCLPVGIHRCGQPKLLTVISGRQTQAASESDPPKRLDYKRRILELENRAVLRMGGNTRAWQSDHPLKIHVMLV